MGIVTQHGKIGDIVAKLPWPLFTIDFEASSLDSGTYPVEVGICRWQSPNVGIEGWSTLIAPIAEWIAHGSWSPASAQIHGIERVQIDDGMTPTATVAVLNEILGDQAAYCDGGPHDLAWARMLAQA